MNFKINQIVVKHYNDADLEIFVEMFTNEELCQFMAGGAFDNKNSAENLFYELMESKKVFGISMKDKLIGHLEILKNKDEIEIVYLLQKEYWGKGIIKNIIEYINVNYTEKIVARVMPNNINSRKMLEKFNIESKKISSFKNTQVIKYIISKPMEKNFTEHWNNAYNKTEQTKLGWFEEKSEPTLDLIAELNLEKNARIFNAGSGSSTLIDDLLKAGYTNLIASDISKTALDNLKQRVGEKNTTFIVDDFSKPKELLKIDKVDLWNDRAALHFLTTDKDIKTYFNLLKDKIKQGAYVILSEFSTDGALKCCGLDVKRYNTEMFQNELGSDFVLIKDFEHDYYNPNKDLRKYIYVLFQRKK